jgi:hypothetical protein
MLETLLGGLFGGVLRLAPEVLKWVDRKDERKHELALISLEHEAAKSQAELQLRQLDAVVSVKEFEAIATASKEQAETASTAGKWVSAISALVRPTITYMFLACYMIVKLALFLLAYSQDGGWKEVVVSLWTQDDVTILFMIISFWFVGRVYERSNTRS